MKKILMSLVITAALCSSAHASLLFSDNFNAGPNAVWGNEVGNWTGVGGAYDTLSPSNSPLTYSSVTSFPGLTDFIAEVDVLGYNDGGVWLRSTDNQNGVLLVAGGAGGGYDGLYWHIVQSGSTGASLQAASIPGIQGTNAHLKFEVIGDTYKVYVNGSGTPASTLVTNQFASGKVALYDYLSETSFDNFALYDFNEDNGNGQHVVPEPSSMLLLTGGLLGAMARRKRRV
ncbi:MAG: PEP-CTERM sorting domain-containing protein [Candidatus Omnitrophica bacterium]|nr:PEP-CTERM sorting domain-containing protein [Candidatus Omnitrophota bacterium]